MPYGIKGETPTMTKWMDDCTQSVMKQGKDKGSAISICKVTMEKRHKKMMGKSEEIEISEEEVREAEKVFAQTRRISNGPIVR